MITERTHAALAKVIKRERLYEERVIRVAAMLDKYRRRRIRIEGRIEREKQQVNAVIARLGQGVSNAK